ncbi:MAG: PEGA domain-containing protein, partial [Acidobacteriota bacterium]
MTPLEELKKLDQQVDQIDELAGLQPLFLRLEELIREHSGNFEVQLVAHDVKQHILTRGSRLRQMLAPPVVAAVVVPAPVVAPQAAAPTPLVAPPPRAEKISAEPPAEKRRPLWTFAAGAAIALIAIVVLVNMARDRNRAVALATPMDVKLTTEPAGASIRVDGQESCTSNCSAKILPGEHQVAAVLDGYEPVERPLTIVASQAGALHMVLQPQTQTVRVFADLSQGEVLLDGNKAGDLQDGQFFLERVQPGTHQVTVAGGSSSAAFSFDAGVAAMPAVQGAIETKQLLAVLVSSFANKARLVSSAGPLAL